MGDQTSVLGNFPQRGVEGKFRETVQISMHLTPPCEHGRLHVSSLKLLATGQWKNVPRKVQISMYLTKACGIQEITRQFQETSRIGAMGERSGKRFKSRYISQKPENTGEYEVSSGKLPAAGRWRNVPGKVQISLQSHLLPNMGFGRSHVSSRKLPATGRWRKVLGKVQMLGSHILCGIRVNSAILKLDRAGSRDADTSTL
jgi:hypothetical protein